MDTLLLLIILLTYHEVGVGAQTCCIYGDLLVNNGNIWYNAPQTQNCPINRRNDLTPPPHHLLYTSEGSTCSSCAGNTGGKLKRGSRFKKRGFIPDPDPVLEARAEASTLVAQPQPRNSLPQPQQTVDGWYQYLIVEKGHNTTLKVMLAVTVLVTLLLASLFCNLKPGVKLCLSGYFMRERTNGQSHSQSHMHEEENHNRLDPSIQSDHRLRNMEADVNDNRNIKKDVISDRDQPEDVINQSSISSKGKDIHETYSIAKSSHHGYDGDQTNVINYKEPLIERLEVTADRDREPSVVHEMSLCRSHCDSEAPGHRSGILHYDVDVESTIDEEPVYSRCHISSSYDLSLTDRDFLLPQ